MNNLCKDHHIHDPNTPLLAAKPIQVLTNCPLISITYNRANILGKKLEYNNFNSHLNNNKCTHILHLGIVELIMLFVKITTKMCLTIV